MQTLVNLSRSVNKEHSSYYLICCSRVKRFGREWSTVAAGTLCISGIATASYAVIGYLSSDWSLLGRNIFYTVVSLQGASCLLMNIPKKSFENDINDFKKSNGDLQQYVSKLEDQLRIQLIDIQSLKGTIESAEAQINRSQEELNLKDRNLEKISLDLEATAKKLAAMEELHTKYQETTNQIKREIQQMVDVNPLILEQIARIESINNGMGASDREEKKIIIEIKSLNRELLQQEEKYNNELDGLGQSINSLIPILKENTVEQEQLGEKLNLLNKGNNGLRELVNDLGKDVERAETVDKTMAELIAKLAEIQQLEEAGAV